MEQLRHVCEVCRHEEVLTPEAAYQAGWDHPPRMGKLGVISPRTCPNCPINQTVWRALAMDHYTPDMLTLKQRATVTASSGNRALSPRREVTGGAGAGGAKPGGQHQAAQKPGGTRHAVSLSGSWSLPGRGDQPRRQARCHPNNAR
jgi:hypothetical protein